MVPPERSASREGRVQERQRLARAGVDEAGFALLIPLPGTPVWGEVIETGEQPDYLDLPIAGDHE
jgi:hypothetical protein